MSTHEALEVVARTLHVFTLAHHHIQDGRPPLDDGRFKTWDQLPEGARRATRWKAQKASELATFAAFYAWTTFIERQMGQDVPAADSNTERTRGTRAEYYLVQHLMRIDSGALL
ncbi:hypothetical protein [Streptomyces sp. NPDC017529]|uniref:hypothetical protein n=1 Tax=Streptomyces sp. NPDC017529 TaxID=3365000 RepID=UPI0037885AEE